MQYHPYRGGGSSLPKGLVIAGLFGFPTPPCPLVPNEWYKAHALASAANSGKMAEFADPWGVKRQVADGQFLFFLGGNPDIYIRGVEAGRPFHAVSKKKQHQQQRH